MTNYPEQLSDLQNHVLTLLNEASNSPIGILASGTGATATILTPAQITQFLNEGFADFARWCYGLRDTATYTNLPANTIYINFTNASLVLVSNYNLWLARTVTYNRVLLEHCSLANLETCGVNFTGNFPNDAAGTPFYWFENGIEGIGIYPPPSANTHPLVISGDSLPKQLVNSSDVSPFQPDMNKVVVYHAAANIARKALDDQSIAERAPLWMAEFDKYKELYIEQQWRISPEMAALHFPRPTRVTVPVSTVYGDPEG